MPPGVIVILRKRSSRPLILAISLPRSIAPSVVSVTPSGLKSTGWRAFGFDAPAGHSPACAPIAVAATIAVAAVKRSHPRLVLVLILDIFISSVRVGSFEPGQ